MNRFLSISFFLHLAGFLILASFLHHDKIAKTSESIFVGLIEYKAEDTGQNKKKISKDKNKVVNKTKSPGKRHKKRLLEKEKRTFLSKEQQEEKLVLKNIAKSSKLERDSINSSVSANETSRINSGKAFELAYPDYKINPKPKYPLIARTRGHEGEVLLKVWVLEDGSVGELKLEKPSGYSVLDESALNSVRNWIFVPGKRNGIPIRSWVTIPIRFQLTSG